MKNPREMLLRQPETSNEINTAIARVAHTLWESHATQGEIGNSRFLRWTTHDGATVEYQQFNTSAHGHQAYIEYVTAGTRTMHEISVDLQSRKTETGVSIGQATMYGDYDEIDKMQDEAVRESIRLRVYQLLQEGLSILRKPLAETDEHTFAAILIDLALDTYQHELSEIGAEDVVSKILSDHTDELGTGNWLLEGQALQKRATEREAR